MSLVVNVIAWTGITVGVLSAARYLVKLIREPVPAWLYSVARVTRAQTVAERRYAWQWFRLSLLGISTAVILLSFAWQSELARWLLATASTIVLLWDRALWLRSRTVH